MVVYMENTLKIKLEFCVKVLKIKERFPKEQPTIDGRPDPTITSRLLPAELLEDTPTIHDSFHPTHNYENNQQDPHILKELIGMKTTSMFDAAKCEGAAVMLCPLLVST
ncbi:hypothetical protein M9H77_11783 [Catharanthus roseus]|uniref:Uncharacterized protein n=1 Tax=Catharanthus roseus TaxID=4058 RepID=A0ACC0BFG9_CATRO|nr:hypothetical protein M9H77_11783 [Catharanthus roseus]